VPHGDLVDTGALLAMVDTRDRWRQACLSAAEGLQLPLVATTSVLTETFYFAAKRGIVQSTWQFVRKGGIRLALITDTDLPALEMLMHRYADRPMDFADATLVRVAEREGINAILTIDHSDFETYRNGRSAKFRILPARGA
jgi:predicted nucleic acid-binding protein